MNDDDEEPFYDPRVIQCVAWICVCAVLIVITFFVTFALA